MIYKATEIKITKTKLVIGVPEPFKLLHVTDSHLIYSDDQDSDMQRKLMAMRREAYDSKHGDNCCRRWCDALFQYAKDNGELLVHTGDLIDYVSHGNLVQAKAVMDTLDDFVKNHQVDVVTLTVPKRQAVEIAHHLEKIGIKAIWNFAPTDLNLSESVCVKNVHLNESLMTLSYEYRAMHAHDDDQN